jgi:hypothetical protein
MYAAQVIYLYTISSLLSGWLGPFSIFPSNGEGLALMLTNLCPCSHGEALCMSHQVTYQYTISSLLLGWLGPFFIFPSHGEGLAWMLTTLRPCSHGEALLYVAPSHLSIHQ